MKIKIINIKGLLNSKLLREHIFKFFRLTDFNSQYVEIIVKVSGDNDSIFYSLSNLTTLDIFNLSEKINYVGSVPAYKFFDNKKVSLADYNEYVKRFDGNKWNLKKETLNYCIRDCVSLYQILIKFINLIYDMFGVDVLKCPTLPSLAFRIFRLNYLFEEIPMLNKAIYQDLVKAYFGGHVDMYIPKGPGDVSLKDIKLVDVPKLLLAKGVDYIKSSFKTLKHYDVNALYPSAMRYNKYPTELIGYFVGDITLIEEYKELQLNFKDNN